MSTTAADRQVRHRLAILRHAEEVTDNVAMTCRYYGVIRQSFYVWKHRYDELGEEAQGPLTPSQAQPRRRPMWRSWARSSTRASTTTSGPPRSPCTSRYHDVTISHSGVWRILKRLELEPAPRLTALQATRPPLAAPRKAAPRPPGAGRRQVHRPRRRGQGRHFGRVGTLGQTAGQPRGACG